jgi:ABC-type bacteriocin/lantibiotic exporter with double-glycine peptidase domain
MIIFFLITGYFKLRNFDAILPIATTFIYAIIRILPASNALLYNVNNIKNFEPHLNRVFPEIEKIKYKKNITLNDTEDYFQVEENNNFQNLKLNNVRFKYPSRSNEFNFNLTIEQGKYYKIIGKNGSGKSTLIKILLGLIHPNSGEYIVNYKKLNKEEILNWQNQMAYVPQDVFLINNKVIDNIAYAVQKDKIDISLAKNVLNIVENSVNEKDKLNLNLKVKDNGNNISGGQKQKIGIARALYLKKKILIFDESFSAIDFFTKDDIIKKLLKSNLTLIEITHDIKDIKDNENLIVLKDRNIFYQGTKKNFNDNLI